MARYTRKVEFRAYQFDPEAVKGMDDYALEDVIIEALALTDGIKSAFVTEAGKLDVVIYTYGRENTKEYFELAPGEWLTTAISGLTAFEVFTDEKFREFATAVQ